MNKLFHGILAIILFTFATIALAEPIDINSASAEDIAAALKGIGTKQAAAIVDYRSTNGPFKTLDDLTKVKGVGAKTLENNKANILFGKGSSKIAEESATKKKSTTEKKPKKDDQPSKTMVATGPVNINKASLEELQTLDGIGPTKAAAIIEYRNANGPFKSADDLLMVKGIGDKTLEKNRGRIRLK